MDLGHGFIPRLDARNYKAVERCLARDGPGMFHEGLDLPWAIVEGPWAVDRGGSTLELCRDRGVSYLVDTQAWRYHDRRTFEVEKFATTPSAPAQPSAVPTPEPFGASLRPTSPSRPPSAHSERHGATEVVGDHRGSPDPEDVDPQPAPGSGRAPGSWGRQPLDHPHGALAGHDVLTGTPGARRTARLIAGRLVFALFADSIGRCPKPPFPSHGGRCPRRIGRARQRRRSRPRLPCPPAAASPSAERRVGPLRARPGPDWARPC